MLSRKSLMVVLVLVMLMSLADMALAERRVRVRDEALNPVQGVLIVIRYDGEGGGVNCWTGADGIARRDDDPLVNWKALLNTIEWPIAPFTWVQGPVDAEVQQLEWIIE